MEKKWSNLSSASCKNFKAELIELSGLKGGNLQEKSIYKPAVEGSSVRDLVLNWDGKRLMFTALDTARRWQVHEINLQEGRTKQVTNIPEPDLEFFDAAYLPDGRMLAISNIGYQGVPCVNGNNALMRDHDSRIYAQFWKDHTTLGYAANQPGQPVIRVSYEEAISP